MALDRSSRFPLLLACAALACLAANQQTLIRTSVHVVEVSVIATDSKGKPAGGLSATDFRVFDNGKEQAIASFERISSRVPPGRAELPPNTWSNRVGDAGSGQMGKEKQPQVLSMILLDAINTKFRDQYVARRAVARILDQIDPAERVAIYALGSRLRVVHDFSSDRASLLARFRAYTGEVPTKDDILENPDLDIGNEHQAAPDPVFKAMSMADKITDTLEALGALAGYVKGVPGRKNLLWLSAGFPITVGTAQRTIAPGRGFTGPLDMWQTFGREMKRTVGALTDANVSVYPIDARGLTVSPNAYINIGTMRELADSTGGKAYYNNNDLPRGVRLALDDSREVYVLTYYPKDIVEDGAYHQIRVQSARQGVQLRFRHGYYATAAEEESAADRLAGVVQSPLDKSEIGLQASLEPGTNENGEITVVVHVDPADLVLARAGERWTGALRLQAVQFGALGQRYEGVAQAVQLDLRPETYQRTMAEGLRLEVRLKREPAAVAVRVGVVEEHGGHVGSVSVPLPRRAAQPLPAR